ncbi:MAG: phytoene desaturase family protein [Actinomycetota bacterium]|nr:phytoene desaturase family protein [Actinomycetota bacterium]
MSRRVVIIGAGLAGLSAACQLSRTGHEVVVVERGDHVGGLAAMREDAGFTFDLGPTVLTMPDLIDEALQAAGTSLADELTLQQLDPAYRARFADGSTMDVLADHDAMTQQIREMCGAHDAAAYQKFVVWLKQLYELEMPRFIDRNFERPWQIANPPAPGVKLLKMGGLRHLDPLIRSRFDDERLHRLFTFQALYAGVSPQQALGIFAVITYMDSVRGVFFPKGGMHDVPRALARAAEAAGVDIRLRTEVTGLRRTPSGEVSGVVVQGGAAGDEVLAADVVIATGDLPTMYDVLLPQTKRPLSLRKPKFSPSAVVWHVGTADAAPDDVRHHNIHFGKEWAKSFDELLDERVLMRDPSRLVSVPSVTDPSRARPGGAAMYVLEPAPHLGGALDWSQMRDQMRERLTGFLRGAGYPTDIVSEHLVTPGDWADQGLSEGTPFALAHTLTQSGPFRPTNFARGVPGLIFAGHGTTPGVGVPMVLVSGKLAAQRALAHLGVPR